MPTQNPFHKPPSMIGTMFSLLWSSLLLIFDFLYHDIAQRPGSASVTRLIKNQAGPYYRRVYSLMNGSELSFFHILTAQCEGRFHVLTKVRLEDAIEVEKRFHGKNRFSLRGRIKSRHLDFLLCNPKTMAPVVAIELDGRSHDRPDRQKADAFLNEALEQAGLPLQRIKVGDDFTRQIKPILSDIENVN